MNYISIFIKLFFVGQFQSLCSQPPGRKKSRRDAFSSKVFSFSKAKALTRFIISSKRFAVPSWLVKERFCYRIWVQTGHDIWQYLIFSVCLTGPTVIFFMFHTFCVTLVPSKALRTKLNRCLPRLKLQLRLGRRWRRSCSRNWPRCAARTAAKISERNGFKTSNKPKFNRKKNIDLSFPGRTSPVLNVAKIYIYIYIASNPAPPGSGRWSWER